MVATLPPTGRIPGVSIAADGVERAAVNTAAKVKSGVKKAAEAAQAPGIIDRIADGTGMALQTVGFAQVLTIPAMILSGLVHRTGGAISWITGNKEGVGGRLKKMGDTIYSPVKLFDVPFDEVGQAIEKRTGFAANERVGGVAKKTVDFFADKVAWAGDVTGYNGMRERLSASKAGKHAATFKTHMGTLNMGEVPASLHGHFTELGTHVGSMNHSATTETLGKIGVELEKLAEKGTLPTAAKKMMASAAEVVKHGETAVHYKDVAAGIRKLPASVSKMSAGHTVTNAAFVGVAALGLFNVARGFNAQLSALRQLHADISGQDVSKVSSYSVLMGKVSKPVSDARWQLLKQYGFQSALQAVSIIFSVKWLKGSMGGRAMIAQTAMDFAAAPISEMLSSSVLPTYQGFKDAHASGQAIPAEYYAEFLGVASPELRARGGAGSAFTKALAQEYVEKKIPPEQIMREIADGTLLKRVEDIKAKNAAAKNTIAAPQASHVASLNGKTETLPQPIGKHTQNEHVRRGETPQPGQTV